MNEDRFPVMGGPSVPWHLVAPFEEQARANHGQTLTRLAQRGGLSAPELWCIVHGKRWREQPSEQDASAWLTTWLAENDGLAAELATAKRALAVEADASAGYAKMRDELKVDRDAWKAEAERLRGLLKEACDHGRLAARQLSDFDERTIRTERLAAIAQDGGVK